MFSYNALIWTNDFNVVPKSQNQQSFYLIQQLFFGGVKTDTIQ